MSQGHRHRRLKFLPALILISSWKSFQRFIRPLNRLNEVHTSYESDVSFKLVAESGAMSDKRELK